MFHLFVAQHYEAVGGHHGGPYIKLSYMYEPTYCTREDRPLLQHKIMKLTTTTSYFIVLLSPVQSLRSLSNAVFLNINLLEYVYEI